MSSVTTSAGVGIGVGVDRWLDIEVEVVRDRLFGDCVGAVEVTTYAGGGGPDVVDVTRSTPSSQSCDGLDGTWCHVSVHGFESTHDRQHVAPWSPVCDTQLHPEVAHGAGTAVPPGPTTVNGC